MILHGWDDLEALKGDFFGYAYLTDCLDNPDKSYDHVRKSKAEADEALDEAEVLFGAYDQGSYEGQAWVLFRKDGKLWEVDASHCSCYGLEQQWAPSEVTAEELRKRAEEDRLGTFWPSGLDCRADVLTVLESL